ncbi:unnamed protein product [Paramecium pentaurelia]|uniref:Phosphagen kinase C-terminal domain-containing protein n=1 Tax=Paramecium pentaurelia TaxID=43138 RepID=A0A8S1UB92_9CILI|nr:unnamed protein product [Paramecium pentaurelia]
MYLQTFGIPGKSHSLTPGHKNFISDQEADELRKKHFLFIDMTSDNYLMSNDVASDWPYGRGIWLSQDETKMVWVVEEDQLRIISIVQGNDLGKVDQSLHELLTGIEKSGLKFAKHPVYGIITTCPTNMGIGKRQSILVKKEQMKLIQKKKQNLLDQKQEEQVENTHLWIKKEQLIFDYQPDSELQRLLQQRDYLKDQLFSINWKKQQFQIRVEIIVCITF